MTNSLRRENSTSQVATDNKTVADNQMSMAEKLSNVSGVLSAFQMVSAANMQAKALKAQAATEQAAIQTEKGNYDLVTKEAAQRYLDAQSQVNTAAAASGIDVGSGNVVAAKKTMMQQLTDFNNINRENAVAAMLGRASRYYSLRAQASRTKTMGWLNAGAKLFEVAASAFNRGSTPS